MLYVLKTVFRITIILFFAYILMHVYTNAQRRHPDIWLTGSMDISENGELFAVSTRQFAYLFNLKDNKIVYSIPNASSSNYDINPKHVSLSQNGRYFASYCKRFVLYDIWDDTIVFETDRSLKELKKYSKDYGESIYTPFSFSPDSRYVFIDYYNTYFDIEEKIIIENSNMTNEDTLLYKAVDNKWIVSFNYKEAKDRSVLNICLSKPAGKQIIKQVIIAPKNIPLFHRYSRKNSVRAGGSRVFILNEENDYMFVIDLENNSAKEISIKEHTKNKDYSRLRGPERPFCVSKDGEYFAVYSNSFTDRLDEKNKNGIIRIYEYKSGKIVSEVSVKMEHYFYVNNLVLNPQISLIALGLHSVGGNDKIVIYNYFTNEIEYKMEGSFHLNIKAY